MLLEDEVCGVWQPCERVVLLLLQYENHVAWLQAGLCAAGFAA
jgi:hypothetical protein